MSEMMTRESMNKVSIAGTLVSVHTNEGVNKMGQPYASARAVVRVHQKYLNVDETSDITVPFFASKFTKKGANNPAYDTIHQLSTLKTIEKNGLAEADHIRVNINRGGLRENTYTAKSGNVIDTWDINARFIDTGTAEDCATFRNEFVVVGKKPEIKNDEETGRLIVRVGIVQYGDKMDVIEVVIDDPNAAQQIDNTWDEGATVLAWGRIRHTVMVEKKPSVTSSWGEDAPSDTTTRTVRELVLTGGYPIDEGAYDAEDVKRLLAKRKQMRENSTVAAAEPPKKKTSFGWED